MALNGLLALVIGLNDKSYTTIDTHFKNAGLSVISESSIVKIKEVLDKQYPRVIVIEVEKGREERLHLIQEVKNRKKYANVPIIILTCDKCKKVEEQAMKRGAFKILKLPVSVPDLTSTLKHVDKISQTIKLEMDFSKKTVKAQAHFDGDITHINEIGYILVSPVRFEPKQRLQLEAEILESTGTSGSVQRVVLDQGSFEGGFKTKFTFAGIDEVTATKIRKYRS